MKNSWFPTYRHLPIGPSVDRVSDPLLDVRPSVEDPPTPDADELRAVAAIPHLRETRGRGVQGFSDFCGRAHVDHHRSSCLWISQRLIQLYTATEGGVNS